MFLFHKIPLWYLIISIFISIYHAYRGYRYYWLLSRQNSFSSWSKSDKITVLCIQAALLYIICSMAGFLSLYASYNLLASQTSISSIGAGSSVLIAFTFIIGIIGVSGELGQLVQQGKLPTPK
jgi:hypothetical protein